MLLYRAALLLLLLTVLCVGGMAQTKKATKPSLVSQAVPTAKIGRTRLGPTAAFLSVDTGTHGNWIGRYGAQGYHIINDVTSYPGYAKASVGGQFAWTWQESTTDTRALQKISASDRIAATWLAMTSFSINVKFSDDLKHRVALYLVDWDYGGRGQKIEVLHPETGAVLDSRVVTGFGDGQYVVWNLSGQVVIRLTRISGANAVCSGIFFDAEGTQIVRATGPVITSVASSNVSTSSATISWVTDKMTDSSIEYGTTTNYGNTTTVGSPLVTNHQVNLVGLSPATLYHYRVSSKDEAENVTRSEDFSFTTAPSIVASAAGDPELPRVLLDTTFPTVTGRTITVNAGGDLQAAINAAAPGDTIVLQAGATFIAPPDGFVLPAKSNPTGQWIVVRSANLAALPAGTRVTPAQAGVMAKIVSRNAAPAFLTMAGANFWRLAGLEVTLLDTALSSYGLISLGADSETDVNRLPTDLVIDRCYIHGLPSKNVRRGIALNSRRTAVIDSYLSDFHETGADSQAIAGWGGPGPFKIVNNYLEGAGENVLFGGADPTVPNLVPSDIEFSRNHLFKPRSWHPLDSSFGGITWAVKNIFELKNARRVLIQGNVFENNWASAQNGFAILFTVRNQYGGAPWSTVEDVSFMHNLVRHSGSAINILGRDDSQPSGQARRLKIKNNVFDDINSALWGGAGWFLLITDTIDVKVENNTIFHTGNLVTGLTSRNTPSNIGFVYRNNVSAHNDYGFIGDNTGPGLSTINTYFPGAVIVGNILAGGRAVLYPEGNYFPASLQVSTFVNRTGGEYRLAVSSGYKNAGTDGKDPGVDMDALTAATGGVR